MPSVLCKGGQAHLDSILFWLRSWRSAATASGQSPNTGRKRRFTPKTRSPEASYRDFNPRDDETARPSYAKFCRLGRFFLVMLPRV